MRDYLEELLDLLTQEDEEEAAGVWKTQTASLILPKALEVEAPEGALELPEGMAAGEADSGKGGDRPWLEREPAPEPTLDLEEIETVPGWMPPWTRRRRFRVPRGSWTRRLPPAGSGLSWGRMGRRRPAQFCWNRSEAGDGPFCSSRRRIWSGGRARRGPGSGPPEPLSGTGFGPPLTGTGLFFLSDGGGKRRRTKRRRGGLAGGEDQVRLIDRAFQRDSRRYDRGFSLY